MGCIWNSNGLEKHCEFCTNIYCDARENVSNTSSTTNQTEMETYEQKYKEALRKATQEYDSASLDVTKNVLRNIFQELAESEDEKIRRELYENIRINNPREDADKYIAWLEKQKTVEWNEEDKEMLEMAIECCKAVWGEKTKKAAIWLKSLKPQHHWKPTKQNIEDLDWCACVIEDKMGAPFHRLQVLIDEIKALNE